MKWIEERGIDVTNVEEYAPPFDDIFVALVTGSKDDA